MKKFLFTFLLLGICSFMFSQTEKTVCEITNSPINGDNVVTIGTVSSVSSDDDFYLQHGGCTIKCDGDQGNLPTVGQYIVVFGKVEVDDDDPLEIDVQSWSSST